MGRSITILADGKPVAWQRATPVMYGDQPLMRTPDKTRQYQKMLKQLAVLQMRGQPPLKGPVAFAVIATITKPKTVQYRLPWKHGYSDVDNYAKTAQDALNGIAFLDDSQICDLVACKRFGRPSLRIIITEIEEGECRTPLSLISPSSSSRPASAPR